MDVLARKTTQIEVQQVQLSHADKEIFSIKTERAILKNCAYDVLNRLSNVIHDHDPILTLTIRNHLTSKLLPMIEILNQMKGGTEPIVTTQQGGDGVVKIVKTLPVPPKVVVKTEPKGNEASGSSVQEKKKGISGESDEDNETTAEGLKRKQRDKELDDNLWITREIEERE